MTYREIVETIKQVRVLAAANGAALPQDAVFTAAELAYHLHQAELLADKLSLLQREELDSPS